VDVDTWSLSTAQAFSGQYSYHVVDTDGPSDQYLDAPSINLTLPAGDERLTLQFQNFQAFEDPAGSGGCWDGGLLEISANGGAWTQLDAELLTDPYDGEGNNGPASGLELWCGTTNGNQPWTNSVVDLGAYAGDDVEIRWRAVSDAGAGAEGWYIDDVTVQACTAVVEQNVYLPIIVKP
jgi:bacillopeptidase F (M6 metalloprotease family)